MAEAGKTQAIVPPPTPAAATPAASVPAAAVDGGQQQQQTPADGGAKRVVQEVVPNASAPPADSRVNPLDIIQQQKAALLSVSEREKTLLERLQQLEAREKQRDEQETQKRKRDEEDEHKSKKAKFVANTNAYFENILRNLQAPGVKSMAEGMRKKVLDEIAASSSAAQLDNIAKTYSEQLEFVHAASADAKVQRDAQEQAELRQHQQFLQNYMSQPPATSVSVSGGMPASIVGQDLKPATTQDADSGTHVASRRNIFHDPVGPTLANPFAPRTTVSEFVPDASKSAAGAFATTANAAPKEVDVNDLSQVIDDHIARTGQFPSELTLRHGGVKEVTRVVASANGGTEQQTFLKPRRDEPYTGQMNMKIMAPAYFNSFVADLNKQLSTGKRDAQFLADAWKWGEKNEAGKFKYMAPYTGPIASDNLVSMSAVF